MKETIHEAYRIDTSTIPHKVVLVFCGDTLEETVDYLKKNGGGIYKNVLHNYQYKVDGEGAE